MIYDIRVCVHTPSVFAEFGPTLHPETIRIDALSASQAKAMAYRQVTDRAGVLGADIVWAREVK